MKQQSETVWIVDDEKSIRWVLERALSKADMEVTSFDSPTKLLSALDNNCPHTIISDIRMPEMDGFELLKRIQKIHPELPVIIMTAHSDMDSAVLAYEKGAFEYLPKPFDIHEATALAQRACDQYRSTQIKQIKPDEATSLLESQEIIGKSPAMQVVFRSIARLSKSSISVLVTGESGTGKELVAKALHTHSPRADAPYIEINTAAIPKDLLESELFGHEKGAFTGAHALRKGRFEQANHGTLFLDEIGDMPAELQTRLLRVLSEGKFYRVGGHTPVQVDVRVIAATHQDLEKQVEEGVFREDLFHRLNVIRIQIPPLRQRGKDIVLLFQQFLKNAAKELQVESKTATSEVTDYLQTRPWRGNVRQLDNLSRWLMVMATGHEITLDDLPPDLISETATRNSDISWEILLQQDIQQRLKKGETQLLHQLTPLFEAVALKTALEKTAGKKKEAADLLGWGRNTLARKIKELLI
ncbi:MAG TPA: nitrogen regulation protein NR(I) [Leucothrix mucor]|uniref:DNA-binding transcriptional regulator NtrC n=1 Tax=Leucothrix mucor TaxID=45248 RepID=A0A7V2SZ45_LEUMU|nr:nitrogen regulation protein NR(I) [Leucothrix mucor]